MARFDHFVSLVAAVIAGVSVVDLFRLKRRALPLFAVSLAITIVALVISLAAQPEYREMLISTPAWFLAGAWVINFAILGYMGWLRRNGTLR